MSQRCMVLLHIGGLVRDKGSARRCYPVQSHHVSRTYADIKMRRLRAKYEGELTRVELPSGTSNTRFKCKALELIEPLT